MLLCGVAAPDSGSEEEESSDEDDDAYEEEDQSSSEDDFSDAEEEDSEDEFAGEDDLRCDQTPCLRFFRNSTVSSFADWVAWLVSVRRARIGTRRSAALRRTTSCACVDEGDDGAGRPRKKGRR